MMARMAGAGRADSTLPDIDFLSPLVSTAVSRSYSLFFKKP